MKLIELLVPLVSPKKAGEEESEADEGEGGMVAGADPEVTVSDNAAPAAAAEDDEVGDMGGSIPEANETEEPEDVEDAVDTDDEVELREEGCCCCCCSCC